MADDTQTQTPIDWNAQGADLLKSLLGSIGQGITNTNSPSPMGIGSALVNHPEVHQAIAEGVTSEAKNHGKQMYRQAAGLDQQNSTGSDASSSPSTSQPTQQPQPQQQQAPTPIDPRAIQQLQQLLGVRSYNPPNVWDKLAKWGGVTTPAMEQAMTGAQAQGAMGPEVMATYAKGQLPLTTEQSTQMGINKFQAQREAYNNQLTALNQQEEQLIKTQDLLGKQRGLMAPLQTGFSPAQKIIQNKLDGYDIKHADGTEEHIPGLRDYKAKIQEMLGGMKLNQAQQEQQRIAGIPQGVKVTRRA